MFLCRVGVVMALLGIACLLVAPVLPWAHLEPDHAHRLVSGPSYDVSLLLALTRLYVPGWSPIPALCILYLLPLLGSCLVAVEGLRAWQGSAATRSSSARLLLGMACALFGLAGIPWAAGIAGLPGELSAPMLVSVGPGAGFASLGFAAAVASGVLLAVGALLHRWTLRRNARHAPATTTG
ncbi:MAG TPA: hypothetical protein VF510_22030 [Ktedonobacterales bacterium]